MTKQPYPENIQTILHDYHRDCVTKENCQKCSSGCCSRGGFAILENVMEIYDLYSHHKLKRKGFKFIKGLNLKDFMFTYFNVWERPAGPEGKESDLIFFHMKSIDEKGRLISIPGKSYWEIRSELFDDNPWLNRGCIFLSHPVPDWPVDDKNSKRHCILHQSDSDTHLGPKPIDCVFFICTKEFYGKTPKKEETDAWFSAIAEAYPNSKARFEKILEEFKTKGKE